VFGPREMGDIGDPAVQGVSVRDRLASDALLRAVHARGLREFVWSVDDPARVQHLLDVGVDGIITDRLDVMRALRGR